MPSIAKKLFPYLLVGLLSAWLASLATNVGDWDSDAGPAVNALAAGHVGSYLSAKAMMGPFATLVQAPFVALSGASGVTAYQWAVFPCLLAAGLAGLYLARIAARRGAGPIAQALIAALFLLNPLTFEALENGHPEEILTAALVVAALAAAGEKKPWRMAILLGLAVASKQWAVIAILPALMVLPAHRVRAGAAAVAVAALLTLPSLAASPGSFADVQTQAAGTGRVVTPWSAWYPFASPRREVYEVGGKRLIAHLEDAPSPADPLSHPLIILLALTLPFVVARRRGLPLSPADGFALLALLVLLRCVLDPVDNLYYHELLLLALIGWDAFASRGLPLRALLGVGVALVFWRALHHLSDPTAFNVAYLGFAAGLAVALLSSLFRAFPGHSFQFRHFSRHVAQISGIK